MGCSRTFSALAVGGLIALAAWASGAMNAYAEHVVNVPVFTEMQAADEHGTQTVTMSWDHESIPDPLQLQWQTSHVTVRGEALEPLVKAFDYALSYHSARTHPTGTLSISTTISTPLSSDGPGAGAALAVGFLAVLKGDHLLNDMALVGALEPTGRIGQVRRIGARIRAAARQGYRVVLVPRGQRQVPHIRRVGMGVEPNIIIREVGTIDEAYEIMTGKRLQPERGRIY